MIDKAMSRFSCTKQEGFRTFSEIFRDNFGAEYHLAKSGHVVPLTAKLLNYNELVNVLKSKDEKLFKEYEWIWDG